MPDSSALPKVIAVDFDDVLMDFNAAFATFNNHRYGTNLAYEDLTRYDDWEVVYGCSKEAMVERAREFYHSPEHMLVSPVLGAVEAIVQLSKIHSLQLVTSRPDSVREQTLTWLDRHFGPVFHDFHFTNIYAGDTDTKPKAKSEVCREIGAVVLIDDALRHATEVARSGIPTLLPDRPWNRSHTPEGVTRVRTWEDIVRWLEKRF